MQGTQNRVMAQQRILLGDANDEPLYGAFEAEPLGGLHM